MANVSLKEYIDSQFVALREYIESQFAAERRAVVAANETMNKRLDGMNEFREALKDSATKFVTREETRLSLEPLTKELKDLKTLADRAEGKASMQSVMITAIVSGLGLLLALISIALRLFVK